MFDVVSESYTVLHLFHAGMHAFNFAVVFVLMAITGVYLYQRRYDDVVLHAVAAVGMLSVVLLLLYYEAHYSAQALYPDAGVLFEVGKYAAPVAALSMLYIYTTLFKVINFNPGFEKTIKRFVALCGLCLLVAIVSSNPLIVLATMYIPIVGCVFLCTYHSVKHLTFIGYGSTLAMFGLILAAFLLLIWADRVMGSARDTEQILLIQTIMSLFTLGCLTVLMNYGYKQARFFNNIDALDEERMLGDLIKAVSDGAFHTEFQPQLDLNTQAVCGLEALLRWRHPERGLIAPEKFIALSEASGLMDQVTMWLVNDVIRAALTLEETGFTGKISINLSVHNLTPAIARYMVTQFVQHGISPQRFVVEITESSLMEKSDDVLDALSILRDGGCKISLDDYGTGRSSLDYLSKLRLHELKIDAEFIQDMATDNRKHVIVGGTIELCHDLDLQVVAEGVEDEQSLDMLKSLHCDIAQGYGIAKPMPLNELKTWLDKQPNVI